MAAMDKSLSTRAMTREAALRLLQAGKQPSAKRIYDIIQRGSLSTIQDELNRWWKGLGQQLSDASDNLPEPVLEMARTSWEMAIQAATAQVQEGLPVSAEASAQFAAITAERNALAKQAEELERSLQSTRAVTEELRQQVAFQQGLLKAAQEDIIQARHFHSEQIQLANSRHADMENRLMVQMDEERQGRKAAEEQLRRLRLGLSPLKQGS